MQSHSKDAKLIGGLLQVRSPVSTSEAPIVTAKIGRRRPLEFDESKMTNKLGYNARIALFVLTVLLPTKSVIAGPAESAVRRPQWIWTTNRDTDAKAVIFEKVFDIPGRVESAEFSVVGDFVDLEVRLNGAGLAKVSAFESRRRLQVGSRLLKGKNRLTIACSPVGGPAAVAAELTVKLIDQRTLRFCTSSEWRASARSGEEWGPSSAYGVAEQAIWDEPQDRVRISQFDDYTQWMQALGDDAKTDPLMYVTLPGFSFERLRVASADEGSWVSMAFDPKGRIVIAREDRGLLRLTLPRDGVSKTHVETIEDSLLECRGLLFAHDSLYAHANNSKSLYRLRDTSGDDRFDEITNLFSTDGGVGHGRNDIVLGPDGKIYAIHGDSVTIPRQHPDWTSPLRKHRRGKPTSEGFVVRLDADGANVEVVTAGLRNPYGIDFHEDGEMFTYDADAEYDMGAPWYRPTRVNHLTIGADFGWRGVTKSWPPYDPDEPDFAPPTLHVGKGSPTAIKFGYGSNYPEEYRKALYILDWAYGRVLAVHILPRGASYVCRMETFVKGRPLNVTDVAFGPDGSMYLITGGRKTRSSLFRVRFTGKQDNAAKQTLSAQQEARLVHAGGERKKRRELESLLLTTRDIDHCWKFLGAADPSLRYAARCVLEQRPADDWAHKALEEKDRRIAISALLALMRADDHKWTAKVLDRVNEFSWRDLSRPQRIVLLRIISISLDHAPSNRQREETRRRLEPIYPTGVFSLDRRLAPLLVGLHSNQVVPRTLKLLDASGRQLELMHYLYVLRLAKTGWTPALRERYFSALERMSRFYGGAGMPTFVKRIQEDALNSLPAEHKMHYTELLARPDENTKQLVEQSSRRKFVRRWTMEILTTEILEADQANMSNRDFQQGRGMYSAALCIACHRMNAQGGVIGPDLSSVASRFSRRDLLSSILEPSKVIAESYRGISIETNNGKLISGQLAGGGDYRSAELRLVTNPLYPDKVDTIRKRDIASHRRAVVSSMPTDLLNTLTKDQILDLLAYLESGGNAKHRLFSPH